MIILLATTISRIFIKENIKQNNCIIDILMQEYFLEYKSNEGGIVLAKYTFKRVLEERNIKVIYNK